MAAFAPNPQLCLASFIACSPDIDDVRRQQTSGVADDCGKTLESGMSSSAQARNIALDYVRATALVLMCLVHMWRSMLKWFGLDVAVLMIGEASPCLFFVAFGMTQHLLVRRTDREKRQYLLILGVISVLHCYFATLSLGWEFFLFLWSSALFVLVGDRLGMDRRGFLLLAAAVAILNVFVPLGMWGFAKVELADPYVLSTDTDAAIAFANRLWVLPGPFFPLPWGILVFFGFALGLDYPRRRSTAVLWAAVMVLVVAVLRTVAGHWPGLAVSHHLALSKWGATSTYLAAGAAGTLLLLAGFGVLHAVSVVQRFVYPVVRFLSDHLLEGTVFHYLVVSTLTLDRFGWTGGGLRPRARLSAVILASVLNVVLLVGGLKLAVALWALLRRGISAVIGEINIDSLGWACLGWLAVLHVVHVAGLLGYQGLRWLAYTGMLVLALGYGDARSRRRERQRTTREPR
jgi:hypothetical protein